MLSHAVRYGRKTWTQTQTANATPQLTDLVRRAASNELLLVRGEGGRRDVLHLDVAWGTNTDVSPGSAAEIAP